MNIFINAISIVEGGGLVVLKKLLKEMNILAPQIKWYIAINKALIPHIRTSQSIMTLPFSWPNRSPLHFYYWHEFVLPKLVKQSKAHIYFSQINLLPKKKLPCPTLLLVQHAGYFNDKFRDLHLRKNPRYREKLKWKLKLNLIKRSIKQATLVTVQTHSLANAIVSEVNIPKRNTIVIPHGIGLLERSNTQSKQYPVKRTWRIGYITKFGVQKDFITAIKAIQILKRFNLPVKLVLTLNPLTPHYPIIEEQIHLHQIAEAVENFGEVANAHDIKKVYDTLDIFIFPSLCESFGFTLVEAMAQAIPIIAANTESNCEIVDKAGHLFNSQNEFDLASKIAMLIQSKQLYETSSKNSLLRSQHFCWTKTAKAILRTIDNLRTYC